MLYALCFMRLWPMKPMKPMTCELFPMRFLLHNLPYLYTYSILVFIIYCKLFALLGFGEAIVQAIWSLTKSS
jgi:hypothetical protein